MKNEKNLETFSDAEYIAALRHCFGWDENKAKTNIRERKKNGNLYGINDLVKIYKENERNEKE